jgi:hypothetical protein
MNRLATSSIGDKARREGTAYINSVVTSVLQPHQHIELHVIRRVMWCAVVTVSACKVHHVCSSSYFNVCWNCVLIACLPVVMCRLIDHKLSRFSSSSGNRNCSNGGSSSFRDGVVALAVAEVAEIVSVAAVDTSIKSAAQHEQLRCTLHTLQQVPLAG